MWSKTRECTIAEVPKSFVVTLTDLAAARVAYEKGEPRSLFYRVGLLLVEEACAGRPLVPVSEALAVLLQTWNIGYYRRQKIPFDAAHFEAIQAACDRNANTLVTARPSD